MYLYLDFHSEYVYLADIAQIHPLPNHMYLYLYIDVYNCICICVMISIPVLINVFVLDFYSEYVYLADIAEIHLLPNHSQEMYSIPFPHGEDTWDQFWEISFESNSIFF